jgi:hypothetical protein
VQIPSAIDLLKQNLDKVDIRYLSKNPSEIDLLEKKSR